MGGHGHRTRSLASPRPHLGCWALIPTHSEPGGPRISCSSAPSCSRTHHPPRAPTLLKNRANLFKGGGVNQAETLSLICSAAVGRGGQFAVGLSTCWGPARRPELSPAQRPLSRSNSKAQITTRSPCLKLESLSTPPPPLS